MAKSYDVSPATRGINAVFAAMTRAGLGKRYRHILTVRGRKSGQLHSTPIDVMADGDRRWLVAGYGVVNWVRNIRVAEEATLRRGRQQELVRATELDPTASVPVLRRYLSEVPVTRPYFDVTTDAPDEVVMTEVARHPVFEITPIRNTSKDEALKTRAEGGSATRGVLRWGLIALLVAHGAIHFLGAANGLGLATVGQLEEPIDVRLRVVWLLAGLADIAAAVLIARRARGWWYVVGAAAVLSEVVIVASWGDAKVGTVVNVLLVIAAVVGYSRHGPRSFPEEYRRRVGALPKVPGSGILTEKDLADLPASVARYVRRSGNVGQPRVTDFRASIHGRIRGGPDKPWMPFTGEQVDTYAPEIRRLFLMDARMFGLPVDVLHVFENSATMRAKVCGLVRIVDAAGEEMDRAETVTVFNDLCVMAPGALVDAPVRWEEIDDRRAIGWFTKGHHTVSALLTFAENGDLVDFVSDDRLRSSPDGKAFTPQRWSTPLADYTRIRGRRLARSGVGRWHAPELEGMFTYLEFEIDDMVYNANSLASSGDRRIDRGRVAVS